MNERKRRGRVWEEGIDQKGNIGEERNDGREDRWKKRKGMKRRERKG